MGHVCLHTGGRTYSLQFARHHGEAYARRNHYIVSTDFNLARHSSPSFGSQHLCSAYSQQCEVDWKSRDCTLRVIPRADKLLFAFTPPLGLVNPMTRIHVRLLGPCFKTGRRGRRPTRQRDENRNRASLAIRVLSRTRRARSQDTRGCHHKRQLHPRPSVRAKRFLP